MLLCLQHSEPNKVLYEAYDEQSLQNTNKSVFLTISHNINSCVLSYCANKVISGSQPGVRVPLRICQRFSRGYAEG